MKFQNITSKQQVMDFIKNEFLPLYNTGIAIKKKKRRKDEK